MSKVVFVGNVPYDMQEDQLIEVFKSVGQVVGFRLVFDRETGKPRGYGFCEFADHETAMSAVRNLHDHELGGRRLRIDLADSDPFLEGKTTSHGELLDSGETRAQWRERTSGEGEHPDDKRGFLKSLPPGVPLPPGSTAMDAISTTLASMDPAQLTEVLAQMKAFVINHPEQARILLVAHPQFSYALFQALFLQKIVDPAILQRMLPTPQGAGQPPAPPPPQAAPPHVPTPQPAMPPMPPPYPFYNQPPPGMPPGPPGFYRPPPPPGVPMAGVPPHVPTPPMPPPPPPQMPGPPASAQPAGPPQPPAIDPQQRDMLMQVLRLTQEQINALPPNDREAVQSLRNQYMGLVNPGT
ncbi:hypothetical protein SCHPADRAFT_902322 [Schizopora paradoxa]|uniref:RRM domain-containing protein n=1 Tax=Schizopora paradoxa TaxID=27342 RepID=A0A0H2RU69_9AGAM|nr:hypothetical protein SCHPADRAFT_902322 [Schizopora paradoxa]